MGELRGAAEGLAGQTGIQAELRASQYVALLKELDPAKPQEQVEQIVGWGFDVAPAELKDGLLLAPGAFLANLCRAGGPVRRSGARRPRRI